MIEWCENATLFTGTEWYYKKIPQKEFEKLRTDDFDDWIALLLIIRIVARFPLMGSGITLAPGAHRPGGSVPGSAGVGGTMNGWMMNDMIAACTDMMRNIQNR